MQKNLVYYILIYTPGGPGRVEFRLEGEDADRTTQPLAPQEFSALTLVLAQKKLAFDIQSHTFFSRNP